MINSLYDALYKIILRGIDAQLSDISYRDNGLLPFGRQAIIFT